MERTWITFRVSAAVAAVLFVALGGALAIPASAGGAVPPGALPAPLPTPVVRPASDAGSPTLSPTTPFLRTAAQPMEVPPPVPTPAPPVLEAVPLGTPRDVLPVPATAVPGTTAWSPAPPAWSPVAPPPTPSPSPAAAFPATAPVAAPRTGWTTPAYRTGESVPPTWTPAPPPMPGPTMAPPPAPPPPMVAAAPAPAVGMASRQWNGCGLACESGASLWHVRLVGGVAFYFGDDDPEPCGYFGLDLGRTFCGCWGLDVYYRWSSAQFDRAGDFELEGDGGYTHHFGGKVTWEHAFGSGSRFYFWVGLGAGWFVTEDYLHDDDGFEAFGEAGLGYVLSRNFRVRLGVNAHYMDTSVGRLYPADDGSSRPLWLVAPVLEFEIDF